MQFVGNVGKVVRTNVDGNSGGEIVFHANCPCRNEDMIWFTVKAQGKCATSLIGEIERGDVVTVFGQILSGERVDGNIYVQAKSVWLHGLDYSS